jgi:DNA-binding winged helix-turn-helix (wHTH) protein/TolB-like protein
MPQPATLSSDPFRLGKWVVMPHECVIKRADDSASGSKITPRAMSVLLYLAERRGRVIAAGELLDALWPNSFTTENAVHKCVAELRHAFEDPAREPSILQTISKRGYKILIEPTPYVSPAADRAHRSTDVRTDAIGTNTGRRRAAAIGAALLVALVLVATADLRTPSPVAPKLCPSGGTGPDCIRPNPSVAVLHFAAQDATAQPYADAMAEAIVGGLTRVADVNVAARRESMAPELLGLPTREAAAKLGVEHILLGQTATTDDRVHLSIQLVEAHTGTELYSERIDLAEAGAARPRDDIAAHVVAALRVHLDAEQRAAMLVTGTRHAHAFLEVNRAVQLIRGGTPPELQRGIEHARRAIELDADYAAAYRWLLIAFECLAPRLAADGAERVRIEAESLATELKQRLPGSEVIDLANLVAARLNHDQFRIVASVVQQIRDNPVPAAVDANGVSHFLQFGWILLGAGLLDEGDTYRGRFFSAAGLPHQEYVANVLRERGEDGMIEWKKEYVARFPGDVQLGAGLVADLARTGRFAEAHHYLERLEKIDPDGVWAHSVRYLLKFREGKLSRDSETYQAMVEHPATGQAMLGHFAFVFGDVASGIHHWSRLTPVERLALEQGVRMWELEYPEHVRADPDYGALLDRLGIGDQWRRYLAAKVAELESLTQIAATTIPAMQVAMRD